MATYGGAGGKGTKKGPGGNYGGDGGYGGGEGSAGYVGYAGSSGSGYGTAGSAGVAGVNAGAGGNGGNATTGSGSGGGGGGGGAAGYTGSGSNLTASYMGGKGGTGGAGGAASNGYDGGGGGGGRGGSGAEVSGSSSSVSGTEKGGDGGDGGNGASGGGNTAKSGDGGAGGYGVSAGQSQSVVTVTSTGKVSGGDGGSSYGGKNAGAGGAGGAGFYASYGPGKNNGSKGSGLTNAGSITGGDGGYGDTGGVGGTGATVNNLETVDNSGTLTGGDGGKGYKTGGDGGSGVYAHGATTNAAGGTITGGDGGSASASKGAGGDGGAGVLSTGAPVKNSGSIQGGYGGYGKGTVGAAGAGVSTTGGSVFNYASGGIAGGDGATSGSGAAGAGVVATNTTTHTTVVNEGGIYGGGGSTASVGGAGISGDNLTVINPGRVGGGYSSAGVRADAIDFTGGTNALTLSEGGTTGTILGSIGAGGSVSIDPGTSAGTNVTLGNQIHDYSASVTGSLTKVGAGTLTLTGANTFSGGTTIDAGTLDLDVAETFSTSNGTLVSGGAGTGAITFAGSSSTPAKLALDAVAQPGAPPSTTFEHNLDDFGAGDTLDLKNFVVTSQSYANDTLTLTGTLTKANGQAQTTTENYKFAGSSVPTGFTTASDTNGGTDVTTVCFAAGTRIRTARGREIIDVAVEHLAVGDLVVTASGVARPIKWLGHRSVDCRRHPHPSGIMPVRIKAHAIEANRPARDLLVSPGHAICLDAGGEVLVPAGALVNGTTITQDDVDTVTYWHVELDSHDILLAENLAAESYIDCDNRAFFAEAGVVLLDAVPDARPATTADYCRPFHDRGALVETLRAGLRLRAAARGWRLAAGDALGDVHLLVDGVRVEAARHGLAVCFALPPDARDVRLVSSASRPCDVGRGADPRPLGLGVAAISLHDGFDVLEVALDDPRLRDGFYGFERAGAETWRWTNGRARLPADLWADRAGPLLLRIDFRARALPRWLAPVAAGSVAAKSDAA